MLCFGCDDLVTVMMTTIETKRLVQYFKYLFAQYENMVCAYEIV
jgi:hypothetical protein